MPQSSPNPFGDLPYQPDRPEELVKAELVPEDPKDRGERISILYLMVWTACTAVILALYLPFLPVSLPKAPESGVQVRPNTREAAIPNPDPPMDGWWNGSPKLLRLSGTRQSSASGQRRSVWPITAYGQPNIPSRIPARF